MSQSMQEAIVGMERAALARWCQGDQSGFLEISASEVTYFDPFLAQRLDGHAALSEYYNGLRGRITADRFELIKPLVQVIGNVAVLTYCFRSWGDSGELAWHCTEVYGQQEARWRIAHSHWSLSKTTQA